MLLAGVSGVQLGQLSEHHTPGSHLLWGILNTRDGLPTVGSMGQNRSVQQEDQWRAKGRYLQLIIHGHLHKVLPAPAINLVLETLERGMKLSSR